jgi:hypothetical protein
MFFDDHCCSRISNKTNTHRQIFFAIQKYSIGGLVGATMTQRPDLMSSTSSRWRYGHVMYTHITYIVTGWHDYELQKIAKQPLASLAKDNLYRTKIWC